MKLNRRQLRRLIENTILEQEGGSTSGSDKAGADRSDPRNVNRALSATQKAQQHKRNMKRVSYADRQDYTERDQSYRQHHAKDMQADQDLGFIKLYDDINIPAGQSVKFKANYFYDEGPLYTKEGDHTKLAAKIDNSKLMVTAEDSTLGRFFAPATVVPISPDPDSGPKEVTWYIKNSGNRPVVMQIEPAGG